MSALSILILAVLLDALIGDPDWLWKRLPHPVTLIGKAIAMGDKAMNTGTAFARKVKGAGLIITLVAWAIALGIAVEFIPYAGPIIALLLAAILIAQRSLADHVWAVAEGLRDDISTGRRMVARIVGRDTAGLNESDVSRAAIESAAENFSDGVVAPIFWFVVAGLPGILVYKVVNTADSMIAHKTPKHKDFGFTAAWIDTILNFIPARLTALVFLAAGWAFEQKTMVLDDAPRHRSWNAGWPEAAMAGVLGVALSGPRSYNGKRTEEPWLNAKGRKDLVPDDIDAAVMLLWRAWAGLTLSLCVLAIVT
jgi:adenosylcobinamide-phosphate synthase